jgi:pimeloyl-ACP methyl ester carboxylesterase
VLKAAPREYAAATALAVAPPDWLDANWRVFEAMCAAAPASLEQQAHVAERIGAILSYDRSGEVGRLTVPQLILGAADDMIVPSFLQRELAAALPRAATHVFGGGGHFFPVTRTEEFVAVVAPWAAAVPR